MAMRMTESLLRRIIREELEELASTGMYETDLEEWSEWDDTEETPPGRGDYDPKNRTDGRVHYGTGSGDRSANVPVGHEEEDEDTFRGWNS